MFAKKTLRRLAQIAWMAGSIGPFSYAFGLDSSCVSPPAVECDVLSSECCDGCDGRAANDGHYSLSRWFQGEPTQFRKRLTQNGINITNNVTSFYGGAANGGIDDEFLYGGHGDYQVFLDAEKLGGSKGQFVQIRAEHRLGESINRNTGAFLPAYLGTDLPTTSSRDLYITNLLFTQFFSESFMVYAGKLDTLEGDRNAFAHGRGIRQFSNAAFVVNPIGLRTVGYSTLGTGFAFVSDGVPIFNFLVLNARDTTTSDGLSELFADGVVLSPELRIPTNFFGKLGHQLFGAIWSSRDFASLDQSPLFLLPSVPIAQSSGSWALTYNFDQYLVSDRCDETKGWGIFGRAGLADDETNPIEYFLSAGIGGNSPLAGRDSDLFGAGWFYSGTSDEISPFLSTVLGQLRDGQGLEIFYNAAVNPRLWVTTDLQYLVPARSTVPDALVVGTRVNLVF
jgi:porin